MPFDLCRDVPFLVPRSGLIAETGVETAHGLAGVSRQLIEYCGLAWDDRCLAFHKIERAVLTASYSQVRQPIYSNSIGRWRRYEKHLGPLRNALGESALGS